MCEPELASTDGGVDAELGDGASADAASDGAPPDAARDAATPDGAVGGCGTFALLRDDFTDGARGEQWGESFVNAPSLTAETNGRLTVNLAAGNAGSAYAGYATQLSYDLRGERMAIEVLQVPPATTMAHAIVLLELDGQNNLMFQTEGGQLYLQKKLAGTTNLVRQVPYDAVAQRWWAFRGDASGRVAFEVSPNGATWTELAGVTPPFSIALLKYAFMGGTWRAEPTASSAVFDNVGVQPPALGRARWCAAASLTDRFDDGAVARAWRVSTRGGGSVGESAGVVTTAPLANVASAGSLNSAQAFDLTGSSVSVRAAQSVNVATPALSTLRIEAAGHFADITEQNGYLIAGLDGASIGSTPYLPATHRFWRLRESGGALLWESSADGLTYMLRTMRMPAPFPLSAVTVHLEASTPAGVATPGAAQWDDYNLPP